MSNAILGFAGDSRHLHGAGRCGTSPMVAARARQGTPGAWKTAPNAYIGSSEQLPQSPACLDSWSLSLKGNGAAANELSTVRFGSREDETGKDWSAGDSPAESEGGEWEGERLPTARKRVSNSFCAAPKFSHK